MWRGGSCETHHTRGGTAKEGAIPANPIPAAEIEVDDDLVRGLLRDRAPHLAGLRLARQGDGWDNVIYRLGDDLVVRLPRRGVVADALAHEQRWLPVVAGRLPLPVPVPLLAGRPGPRFPWPWSICPWFPGRSALETPPDDDGATGALLGAFVAALHRDAAPPDAPVSPFRGGPLADRAPAVDERVTRMAAELDEVAVRAAWAEALAAPRREPPVPWIHGDLHLANLIVDGGRLVAVIDWIDLCAGDPATDLAAAWGVFGPRGRVEFAAAVGPVDEATWTRARGWALYFGVTYLAEAADRPAFRRLGARVVAEVLRDRELPGA